MQESAHQLTIGNPQGDVTVVEFFDYNCGYCKQALGDTLALLKDDPKAEDRLEGTADPQPGLDRGGEDLDRGADSGSDQAKNRLNCIAGYSALVRFRR